MMSLVEIAPMMGFTIPAVSNEKKERLLVVREQILGVVVKEILAEQHPVNAV